MSHDGRLGRVFFTSIPKCGKNLFYSFVYGVGLSRQSSLETDRRLAVQQTYTRHFHDADVRRTFPYPAGGSVELTTYGMHRFLTRVPNMPDGTVLGDHFSFDAELYTTLRTARIPIAFLYRDPRDCLLSMANYVLHRGLPTPMWSL